MCHIFRFVLSFVFLFLFSRFLFCLFIITFLWFHFFCHNFTFPPFIFFSHMAHFNFIRILLHFPPHLPFHLPSPHLYNVFLPAAIQSPFNLFILSSLRFNISFFFHFLYRLSGRRRDEYVIKRNIDLFFICFNGHKYSFCSRTILIRS